MVLSVSRLVHFLSLVRTEALAVIRLSYFVPILVYEFALIAFLSELLYFGIVTHQQFTGELSCRFTAKNLSVPPKLVCISRPAVSAGE